VTPTDASEGDVVMPSDSGDDVPMESDGTVDTDVPMTGMDVPIGSDVPTTTDVPIATDVPTTVDVPIDSACGDGSSISITRPASGAMVETCSAGDMDVYYDFVATSTGPITSVVFQFFEGPYMSPPTMVAGPSPYTLHQLVASPTNVGALNRYPDALRNSWTLRVSGVTSCGTTITASIPFDLIYSGARRCPNP
jgi:hypothetical protein